MLVHPQGCREATSIVQDLGVVVHDRQAMCDAVLQVCKTVEYGRFVRKIEYNPELASKPVRVYQKNEFRYDCDATPESILQTIKEYYEL